MGWQYECDGVVSESPPSGEEILKRLKSGHPRVMIDESTPQRVREVIDRDPHAARWFLHLKSEAESLLEAPPTAYEIPDGRRLLAARLKNGFAR